jgi:hypothetical protein
MSEEEKHTLTDEEGIPVWDPNLYDENYVPIWDRDLRGKTLDELTKLSLSVALRVLSLAKKDPEEAKKFFRKSPIMPIPRFLSKTEVSLFGQHMEEGIKELEWGEDLKAVKTKSKNPDSGKIFNLTIREIRSVFDKVRGTLDKEAVLFVERIDEYLEYNPKVGDHIKALPTLDQKSVSSWATVMRDWVLIIEKIPKKDLVLFDPNDAEIADYNPAVRDIFSRRFRKQEESYAFLMNEIYEELKNTTEDEKAERNKTYDRREKEAVEGFARIEEGTKSEFEDRVKEWKPLYPELKGKTKFPEDWTDEQWAKNLKPWNKYQEIKAQRAESIEGAADSAKKFLLYDRIRKRLKSVLDRQA